MSTRVALLTWFIVLLLAHGASAKDLDIYFIDVEGGQSTLIVTPSGQSMLIDAGYAGRGGRDVDRILEVAHEAHLTQIDYLLITHFHPDHVGGVAELAARIPIGTFIDYGQPLGTPIGNDRMADRSFPPYEHARRDAAQHIEPHVGDRLPLKDVDAMVVSAAGELLHDPLPGAGELTPECDRFEHQIEDGTENYRSIGVIFRFGNFSFLDIGDLSGDTFVDMFCPRDRIGQVSAYLIAHHGNYDTSAPAAYAALRPRVAIMDNGPTKGGDPAAFTAAHTSGVADDVWQLHVARNPDAANSSEELIANIDDGSDGHWLKLSAESTGAFTIVNSRTGAARLYTPVTHATH